MSLSCLQLRPQPTEAQTALLKRLKVADDLIRRMTVREARVVIEVLLADKKRRAQKDTEKNRKKLLRLSKRLETLVRS